jgi:hypothetical protein
MRKRGDKCKTFVDDFTQSGRAQKTASSGRLFAAYAG